MRKIEGNTKVKGGFYFNLNEWEIVVVHGKEGVLPGEPSVKYLRVPTLALFVLAPAMGGLFVMFLPFIGFAMLFEELGKKAVRTARGLGGSMAMAVAPAWRPGEAHLAGKHPEETAEKADEAKGTESGNEPLEGLLKEIEDKRKNG